MGEGLIYNLTGFELVRIHTLNEFDMTFTYDSNITEIMKLHIKDVLN